MLLSIQGASVISRGTGIKEVEFTVPSSFYKDLYNDTWKYVTTSGSESSIKDLEFIVKNEEWQTTQVLSAPNYSFKGYLRTEEVSLYEKKWLKFQVADGLGNLRYIDRTNVYFKDYSGSSLYLSDSTITDGTTVNYFFNSSTLQNTYPEYITRSGLYEWILEVFIEDQSYRVDPIAFSFSDNS
jgi:hypothetical protein